MISIAIAIMSELCTLSEMSALWIINYQLLMINFFYVLIII